MAILDEARAPSIRIYVSKEQAKGRILFDVTCGVEEESIPYEVVFTDLGEAVSMAYQAAKESVLQVGIGIDQSNMVAVHFQKLPEGEPLFLVNGSRDKGEVRSISSNAARLVKGTPFIL